MAEAALGAQDTDRTFATGGYEAANRQPGETVEAPAVVEAANPVNPSETARKAQRLGRLNLRTSTSVTTRTSRVCRHGAGIVVLTFRGSTSAR